MFGTLNPTSGGDPIPLYKESLLVGRLGSCDITLKFPSVSSKHCQLDFLNGYWRVRDLDSSNGTRVNGEKCEQRWLMPGDNLWIAKVKFTVDYEPLGDEPPPEDDHNMFEMSLLEKAGMEKSSRRSKDDDESTEKPANADVRPTVIPDVDDPEVPWLYAD